MKITCAYMQAFAVILGNKSLLWEETEKYLEDQSSKKTLWLSKKETI